MKRNMNPGRPGRGRHTAACSVFAAVLICLAVLSSGCGVGGGPKVAREDGKIVYDYSAKSDSIVNALERALCDDGILDRAAVAGAKRQSMTAPSLKAGTYLRWNACTYEAPPWNGSSQALSDGILRAVRKAGARLLEEPLGGQGPAGRDGSYLFRIGYSDRKMTGLATALECVRLAIPQARAASAPWTDWSGAAFLPDEEGLDQEEGAATARAAIGEIAMSKQLERDDLGKEAEAHASNSKDGADSGATPYFIPKEAPLPAVGFLPGGAPRARLAIVVDDLGGGVAGTEELMNLGIPLTVAVLPHGRFASEEAKRAAEKGYAVILHQPMEALDSSKKAGAGAVLSGMGRDEIRRIVSTNIDLIPGALGVSNHMGSRITESAAAMRAVIEEVSRRGLFFFDSRTTANSVAAKVAREAGVPTLENTKFIDHLDTEDYVVDALRAAARIALTKGSVAVIGHVRPATMRGLQRVIPELKAAGVELVRLDQLLLPGRMSDAGGSARTTRPTQGVIPGAIPAQADSSHQPAAVDQPAPGVPPPVDDGETNTVQAAQPEQPPTSATNANTTNSPTEPVTLGPHTAPPAAGPQVQPSDPAHALDAGHESSPSSPKSPDVPTTGATPALGPGPTRNPGEDSVSGSGSESGSEGDGDSSCDGDARAGDQQGQPVPHGGDAK